MNNYSEDKTNVNNLQTLSIMDLNLEKQMSKMAIPFISITNSDFSKFEVNPEAEDFLKKLIGPIGILCVAGMYRTGKSYLLNKVILNNENNPFQVGPTINACTKGLWIYPEALKIKNKVGEEMNLIVIDTEGIGATDEDKTHDTKIFSLALLLSSYFIYNSVGSIDENALSNLSFVSNLAKHIQINNDTKPFLPSFLWVLRDFSLKLVDKFGNPITTKEYLENSLSVNSSSGICSSNKKMNNKNSIREHLQTYFPDRDCVALVRPTIEEKDLQNLVNFDISDLRPEFIEQSSQLRTKIYMNMKAKELNNKQLTGELFISMAKTYTDLINKGSIPNIESAFIDLAKFEIKSAVEQSITKFKNLIFGDENINSDKTVQFKAQILFPQEEYKLFKKLNSLKQNAKTIIDSKREYNPMYVIDDCYNQFNRETEKIIDDVIKKNREMNIELIETFMENNYDQTYYNKIISADDQNNSIIYKQYITYLSNFKKYVRDKGPKGPASEFSLNEFLSIKNELFFESYIENLHTQIKQTREMHYQEKEKINDETSKLKLQHKNENSNLSFNLKKIEKELLSTKELSKINIDNLEEKINQMNEEIIKLKDTNSLLNNQIKEIKESNEKVSKSENEKFEREISSLKELINMKEKENLLLLNKNKQLQEDVSSLSAKVINSNISNNIMSKSSSTAVVEKLESQIKSLNLKIENIQNVNITLETKLVEKEKRLENEIMKNKEEKESNDKLLEDFSLDIKNKENKIDNLYKEIKEIKILNEKSREMLIKELENLHNNDKNEYEKKIKIQEESIYKYKNENDKLIQQLEYKDKEEIILKDEISKLGSNNSQLFKEKEYFYNENTNLKEQIKEISNEYNIKLQEKEEEKEEVKKKEEYKHKELEAKLVELQMEIKSNNEQYQIKYNNYNKINKSLEEEINKNKYLIENLHNEISSIKSQHENEMHLIKTSENEKMENILKKARDEIADNNLNSKRKIEEFKAFYDKEKEEYSKKIEILTDKHKKTIEEMKNFHKEELIAKENEFNNIINELNENMDSLEIDHQNEINELQVEFNNLNTLYEATNSQLIEANKNLESFKCLHSETITSIQNSHNNERQLLDLKIGDLNKNVIFLEKEKSGLNSKLDYLTGDVLKSKENRINELIDENKTLKLTYEEKIKQQKEKIKILSDSLSTNINELKTQLALSNQEISFKNVKISSLEENLSIEYREREEKLKKIRSEIEEEFKVMTDNLFKDKQNLEEKVVELKKELIKSEQNSHSLKGSYEKELAVLKEKYLSASTSKEEILEIAEKEREKLNEEISELAKAKNNLKQEQEKHISQFQSILNQKEEVIRNINNKLENQESSNQLKIEYLEKKNTRLTNEYKEKLNEKDNKITILKEKYQSELWKVQKLNDEKMEKIVNMNNQINKELKENNLLLINSLEEREKKALEDIKRLNERNNEIMNENKTLQSEFDLRLREELEKKIKEINSNNMISNITKQAFDELKVKYEEYKNKVIQLENKLMEYENKESVHFFTIEKVKGDNLKEIDNLKGEINRLNSKLTYVEKEKEEINSKNLEVVKENILNKPKKLNFFAPRVKNQSPRRFTSSISSSSKEKENLMSNINTKTITHKASPSLISYNKQMSVTERKLFDNEENL